MRDEATLQQLLVLANMESYHTVLIEQSKPQAVRLVLLRDLAVRQIRTLEALDISHLPQLTDGGNG